MASVRKDKSEAGGRGRASTGSPRERLREILRLLARTYPDAHCELNFATPLELLVATILSAQCTDARVNQVTASLFKKYRSAVDFARADPATFEQEIRSTGFFRNKAKNILACCQKLVRDFGGTVPRTMEELVTLPGVGRKTANVVLGNAFGVPGLPVDTHVLRLSGRLGFTESDDPVQVEQDLCALLPRKDWTMASHHLIFHGRRICFARKPACGACPVFALCPSAGMGENDPVKAAAMVKG